MFSKFENAAQVLYDLIAEPDRWVNGLDEFSEAIGIAGCIFLSKDGSTAVPHSPTSNGISGFIDAFISEEWYKRDDTASRGWPLLRDGGHRVLTDNHITSAAERRKLEYYQDFRYRWDLPHWAAIGLGADRCLAVLRNSARGEFSEEELKGMGLLVPYLSQTSHLANIIGKSQITTSIDLLERLSQAACLISWSGRVIALNQLAEAMMDHELFISQERLSASHQKSRDDLEALVRKAVFTGMGFAKSKDIALSKVERRERRPIVAQAIPLAGKMLGVFTPAVAIILLTDLDRIVPVHSQMLMTVWGLTPAECRIAIALCEGKSLDEAAASLGIMKETARAQLKNVFGKVEVHKQSELVAKILSLTKTL